MISKPPGEFGQILVSDEKDKPKLDFLEDYCNFCGTPDTSNLERKCERTPICTNYKKDSDG